MPDKLLTHSSGSKFIIEESILEGISSYKQVDEGDLEAGGILIGEYRGNDMILTSFTVPSILDKRTRYGFYRRSPHHQATAISHWAKSGSTSTFAGEWHTHPEDHPSPSALDISEWKKKLPKRKMVLMIQGRKSIWFGLWNDKKFSKFESQLDIG